MISINNGDLKVVGNGIEMLTDITVAVGYMARTMCETVPSWNYKEALQEIIECVYTQALKEAFPATSKGGRTNEKTDI